MPGGLRFLQAETNFSITPWSSFESAVGQIITHRLGNRYLMEKNGWSVDPATVAAVGRLQHQNCQGNGLDRLHS
jgi:hypothetical protein